MKRNSPKDSSQLDDLNQLNEISSKKDMSSQLLKRVFAIDKRIKRFLKLDGEVICANL
jgi:hypothetical protein